MGFSFKWLHLLNIWCVRVYISQSHIAVLVFNYCLKPVPNIFALWTEHPEGSSAENCPAPSHRWPNQWRTHPHSCAVPHIWFVVFAESCQACFHRPGNGWAASMAGHLLLWTLWQHTYDRPLLVALWVTGSTLLVQIHLECEGCWNPINIFA